MLLTKEVDYKVNARSLHYYKDLGYDCKIGDIIKVKVEDLKSFSISLVEYQCDKCKEIFELPFRSFSCRHKIDEETFCVKCANEIIKEKKRQQTIHYVAKDGYKICTLCNRKLPADSDHFNHKCDTKDGFTSRCKECLGRKFTTHLTRIPQKGYKFCKKCDRELPVSSMYFPTDKQCSDGLRNICRECDKKYGNFLDKPPVVSKPWSEEDLLFLKSIYADYTNEELVQQFFPNRTIHSLESIADKYRFTGKTEETYKRSCQSRSKKCSQKLKGKIVSEETKQKLSEMRKKYYETHDGWMKGKTFSEEHRKAISLRMKGKWAGENNPRVSNPLNGENNPNWKGGITSLYQELRSDTKQWFLQSAEFTDYNCVITGNNFDNVHHLYLFKNIVNNVFDNLQIDKRKNISEYSKFEEEQIRNELKNLHNSHGYGAPLNKNIHKLFHDIYGYTDTNYCHFLDFIQRIELGEFNQWFKENNLNININYKYIDYIEGLLKEVV